MERDELLEALRQLEAEKDDTIAAIQRVLVDVTTSKDGIIAKLAQEVEQLIAERELPSKLKLKSQSVVGMEMEMEMGGGG